MASRLHVAIILALYIFFTTFRVVTTKITDLHMITFTDLTTSEFRHPVFQTLVGFFGELIVSIIWSIWFMISKGKPVNLSKTSLFMFLIPGMCDICDALFFNMGMTAVSPSISTMVRSIESLATALLSYYFMKAKFSWQ